MTISDIARLRPLLLQISAVTALIAASMPPMPSPVSRRQRPSVVGLLAVVARPMPTAITTRQPSTVGRRPNRSAAPPSTIEPKPMPISSIDSTTPSASRPMPHSLAMPGAAKALDSTSNPSSALSAIISTTAIHCRAVIGDWRSPRADRSASFLSHPRLADAHIAMLYNMP
jgi:hypothetical protein